MSDSWMKIPVEQRHLKRISLPRPVLVRSGALGITDSAALLQNISAVGAYLYTLLPLTKGDVVELFLALSDRKGTSRLSFTGTVVRSEVGVTDNSMGVAVRFSGFTKFDDGNTGKT